jgi:hypothetical protein
MKKLSPTLVLVLLVGVSALAYGKGKPLADQQLDQISAGSAVADGLSTANDTRTFTVTLTGTALNAASANNIVNAADSLVANGLNAWTGTNQNNVTLTQFNTFTQTFVPCDCFPPATVTATSTRIGVLTETDAATATAIALDTSTANSTITEAVTLDGAAEANARAANIVNAAGSLVANGANAATSTNMNTLTLTQFNTFTQLGR